MPSDGGDRSCFGCLAIAVGVMGIAMVAEAPGLGTLMILAAIFVPVFWRMQDKSRDRKAKEQAERARVKSAARRQHLDSIKQRIVDLAGPGKVVAMCSGHSKLIRPSVCLLALAEGQLEIIALRVERASGLLERLAETDLETLSSNLRFGIGFDDIHSIHKKQGEIAFDKPPGSDDRLGRAVAGGVLFGGAGAVVGALTGNKAEGERVVIQEGDKGGIFDLMDVGQTLITLNDGDNLIVDGPDSTLNVRDEHRFGEAVPTPWRNAVGQFLHQLEEAIHDWRLG